MRTITKVGARRLRKLCDYMESLPKSANKHFSMWGFYEHDGEGHHHAIPAVPRVEDLHSCGTTACALGWAMTVPSLRKAGLELDICPPYWEGDTPSYEVLNGEEVFGLDNYGAWDALFGGDRKDRTPKAWAKRVRKLLKKWESEQKESE